MSQGVADSYLLAIDEYRAAVAENQPPDLALNRIVTLIANSFQTDVGSIYLVEPSGDSLVLAATVGLLQSCVGRLRMRFDEGLVGLVAERQAPVMLASAPGHPRFKYFPEADEDEYQSFLGVPVIDGPVLRGVLVVQTIEQRLFSEKERHNLARVASLVGLVLNALPV